MSVSPYIFFSGGVCAEAFTRYQEVLGGELQIARMSDMPAEERMPEAAADSVMHASLDLGDAVLMGSDDPTGDGGPRLGMSVAYVAPDVETATRVFESLSEGGQVQMPLTATSWSAAFGFFLDSYGVPWMIDTEAPSA